MSVGLSHIVRHDFKHMHDLQACSRFVIRTAYALQTQLHDEVWVRRGDVSWKDIVKYGWRKTLTFDNYNDLPAEFVIELNRYDVRLTLRNGFWEIDSMGYSFF